MVKHSNSPHILNNRRYTTKARPLKTLATNPVTRSINRSRNKRRRMQPTSKPRPNIPLRTFSVNCLDSIPHSQHHSMLRRMSRKARNMLYHLQRSIKRLVSMDSLLRHNNHLVLKPITSLHLKRRRKHHIPNTNKELHHNTTSSRHNLSNTKLSLKLHRNKVRSSNGHKPRRHRPATARRLSPRRRSMHRSHESRRV